MRGMNLLTAAIVSCGVCMPASGIVLNQVDTFQGTTSVLGWAGGTAEANVANGGPLGAGDRFLRIQRTVANNPFGTFNLSQWAGDYLAAGVGAVRFDLNHLVGTTPLEIRIMLFGPGGTWTSTVATPVGAGWNTYTFGLSSADLTHVIGNQGAGTGVLADTLAGATRLLIRHDPGTPNPPGVKPPSIIATMGLDNITAIAPAPQPGDTDGDFDVDADDLLAVKDDFGNAGPSAPGDADGDGDTDIDDLVAVKNNMGASFPGLGPGLSPGLSFVPEPTSLALLGLSAFALLRRR